MVMKQQDIIFPWSILLQEEVLNESSESPLFMRDW